MEVGYNVEAIVKNETAEYHRYLRREEVRVQCCAQCGYLRYPQRFVCPECLSEESDWKPLSGRGKVETFIWYFKNILDTRYTKDWSYQDAPYNVAVVRLEEGPRLITNIEETGFGELKAGQAVEAVFVPISEEYAILRFKPISPAKT